MFSNSNYFQIFSEKRRIHNAGRCEETNKLVVKLYELLKAGLIPTSTPVVEWAPNEDVKLCPYCAKSFNHVSRRRHHCRTCGAILCNSCSRFLEKSQAERLVGPTPATSTISPPSSDSDKVKPDETKDKEKDHRIRLCEDCDSLLQKRLIIIENHYFRPKFCEFYDQMREKIQEIGELVNKYVQMCGSLRMGDGEYNLSIASELRSKIDISKDRILILTKQMISMAQNNENDFSYLLTAIHESVVHWMRTKMMSLPSVPSEADYEKAKAKRREELLSEDRFHSREQSQSIKLDSNVDSNGWVPEQSFTIFSQSTSNAEGSSEKFNEDDETDDNDDPLKIQIRMLDEYIRQAKLANRYEEVNSLEASKRELEIELNIRKLSI